MRVLITGAGGFIGSHLVADQLARGHSVTAVDLHTETLAAYTSDPALEELEGDFTDRSLLDRHLPGHDVCFHLASAHLETGVEDSYYHRINVEGAREFVRRCHEAGIGRFVHCSSVGVYGDIENPPADEETECHPDILYEKTKLAGERAVRDYAEKHEYPVVVVRPAWVYGPGCPRTEKLFRTIEKGRFFFVGDGSTLRHPIYVGDMVAGFHVAATHENAPGGIFIMAGPRAVTLRELTGEIAACLGVPAPRLQLPMALVYPGCYLLEVAGAILGRDMPFTTRSLKFFTGNTAFKTDRARDVIGYEARTDLRAGLRQTHAWLSEAI